MKNQIPRKRRTRRPSLTRFFKEHGLGTLEQYCLDHDNEARMKLASEAQQIILASHECADDLDQIQMCLQALEIYPLAADALTLIATIGDYDEAEVQILLEMATEAAKLDCLDYLKNDVGYFWGILETRPYMRAYFNLAQVLLSLDKVNEVIDIYKYLLVLDENDSLGVRFKLLPLLHKLGLKAEAQTLSDKYEIEFDEVDK